jgi:uncharacterized protein YjiS (DUF1127 family)
MKIVLPITATAALIASTRSRLDLFNRRWGRERSRADLHDLSDKELLDVGISRGKADYLASNRSHRPARRPIHQ